MRFLLTIFVLTFLASGYTFAQTQLEMNMESSKVYEQADDKLNSIYQQIRKKYSNDPTFLLALRNSQRNWIAFRDSELKMKYPDRGPYWYGSIHPVCVSYYMAELTNERTETLKEWIIGIEDDDVCAGTTRNNYGKD